MNNSNLQEKKSQILDASQLHDEWNDPALLESVIQKSQEGCTTVIVDCSSVKYINSVGVNFLIGLYKKVVALNGQVILRNPSDAIVRVIELTKLNSIFQIEYTNTQV